jgi:hypothetical protein
MFTLTIQLLVTGFFVAVVFQRFFSSKGSRIIYIDLVLSILGAFLGTLIEAWIRSYWTLPLMAQILLQYLVPLVSSTGCVVFYRVLNRTQE